MNYSYNSDYDNQYGGYSDGFAADAAVTERVSFIKRTYAHVFGAILLLVGIDAAILSNEAIAAPMAGIMLGNWWAVLLVFMVTGWVADKWATSGSSPAIQYLGLALYTVAEAVILVPLLYIAARFGGANIIPTAGFLTLLIFGGLTMFVFVTKQDFSFLRNALAIGTFAAMGFIIAGMLFGFSLGIFFVVAMIALMSGYILYFTSNVLHHYHTSQHVAASLALFSSIATLFWYVLQLLMMLSGDD